MRVVFVTNVYPNNFGIADGIFVHEQAKMMQEKGCEVDVLYIDLRSARKKRKWGKSQEEYEGINIFHYSILLGPIPILMDILYLIVQKWALYDYIKRNGIPDIIHAHFYINAYFSNELKKEYGIRYLITEHSSELYQQKISMLHRYIIKKAYDNADYVIAVSEALKKRMERYTERDIVTIPNMLSDKFYYDGNNKKGFHFLFVGHVIESKGVRILLEAFNELQQSLKDVSLTIVGEGALKKELMEYAKSRHLDVIFMGEIAHEYLPDVYRKSHCFVLPSKMETFGISYIEALASGIPVIATRCGGPEEFINTENGILISVDSKKELYEAMKKIYDNIIGYSGKEISENTIKKYGKAAVGEALMELYLGDI